jgi:outer membrane autotransporter protein
MTSSSPGAPFYATVVVGDGINSTGTFNQSGGTVIGNGGALEIGVNSALGTYAMTNNASLTMGLGSTTYLGYGPGGVGLLHVSGNSTFTTSGQAYLGSAGGGGTILQDGAGSVVTISSATSAVFIGSDADSTGNYNLSAGTLNLVSGTVDFGYAATSTGNLNQTGGTLTAGVLVTLGADGAGNYNLSAGLGTFNAGLQLADFAGSTGTINLSGTGTLQVGGTNGIAQGAGTAAVNLGGGTLEVIGSNLTSSVSTVLVANTTSTVNTGTFNASLNDMSGSGSLNKTGSGNLNVGGALTWGTGSAVTVLGSLNFGTVNADGTATLNAGSSMVVTGQTATGTGRLQVGYGGTGTLNLAGGNITLNALTADGDIRVGQVDAGGNTGHGTVNFSSGTISLNAPNLATTGFFNILVVGEGLNSTGTFNQSGGSLTGTGVAFEIGVNQGVGTYVMTNQANVALGTGSSVFIGDSPSGVGLLHISGNSTFTITSGQTFIGTAGGVGTIEQDGAGSVVTLNSAGLQFYIGSDPASTGNYDLSAGTLQINSGDVEVGASAGSTGNLNQSGGTLVSAVTVFVGDHGTGTYNLSGGTGTFMDGLTLGSVAGSLGVVNQTGGIATISGGVLNLAQAYVPGVNATGSLYNLDAGTLQVGGTNGISGAGTLALGGGTVQVIGSDLTTSIITTLAAGTQSTIDTNGLNATWNSNISGATGGLTKIGAGDLDLTGVNTYSGGTLINGGTLTAGSATALGLGNVTNDGVLNAGNGNHALNVNGTYAQQAGGTLSLTINSATVHDDLTVTGTATLGGLLQLNLAGGYVPPANTTIDLIQTGGLNDTKFSGLAYSGLEIATLEYSNTDVSVLFSGRRFLAGTAGLTSNQAAVAGYIDEFAPTVTTGNFGNLVNYLYSLAGTNTGALRAALDQLSPQSLQVFRSIAFDNATFNSQQLNGHLANLRDGLTGFDGSQLSVIDSTLDPTLSQINSRLLAWNPNATPGLMSDSVDSMFGGVDMKDARKVDVMEAPETSPWSTFIAGNVVLADLSHGDDVEHQNYTTGSVQLGADYRLDPHFTVGALLAYGHTDATLDHNGSSATVDSYSPGIYASYVDGGWYGNALFAYGYNSYTEDRNVSLGAVNGTNHGAPQGNQFTGNLTGGYEFHRGGWKFGPVVSLQYVNLGIDSFSEDGPTALNIRSQSEDSLRSQFGLEARYAVRTGSVILTPHISASWQHEFMDNSEGITSQFNQVGSGSFTVQTANPERDSAFIDLGLDAQIDKTLTLFLDYQTEAGQSNFFAQSVQAGVKIGF